NPELRDDPLEAGVPLQLEIAALLEEPRHRDVVGVRDFRVRLIGVDVVARMRVQLADPESVPPFGPEADAEIDEMLADATPLDEADVVAEVVADAQQGILRVEEVVVPDDRPLAGHLAAVHLRRGRLREEAVDAQRGPAP